MKRITRAFILTVVFLGLIFQTGCWDQKLFEQIGFILQMGLETGPDGELLLSMTSPVVEPGVKQNVEFLSTTTEGLIRAPRERMRNVSGKLLQGGKIQLVYFSKELAEKGVKDYLEIFFRDPENPLLANVVVVDGSPREMMQLSLDYKNKPRPSIYVNNLLLDARRRSAVPESRIYDFCILNYSGTIDPVTPVIRYNKENVEAAGTALFSGERMVGEVDVDRTMLLNMLMGKKKSFQYVYTREIHGGSGESNKIGTVVTVEKPKRKIKVNTGGNTPVIDIKLQLKGILLENSWTGRLDEEKNKKRVEDIIAGSIKFDCRKLLNYLQEVGADPVGFGEIVRVKNSRYWKSVKWKDVYRNAVINVDVKMNIESYGTIR